MNHKFSLVRLRPLTTYSYDVFVVDERGQAASAWDGTFMTGPIPAGLREAVAVARGQPTYSLTLKELNDDDFHGMVVLDSEAYIVWYYESPDGVTPIAQKSNGNLVYISPTLGLREVTPLGEEVGQLDESCLSPPPIGQFHHEVLIRPDNKVLYLSSAMREALLGDEVRTQTSDTLWEWDQSTGSTRLLFDIFDFVPATDRTSDSDATEGFFWMGCRPVEGVQDWTHSNSLFVGRRGNVILSVRHLDRIVSISPDFQSIEWRLGGPGGDFTFPSPSDRFYHQHSAVELPDDNILLFDNGNFRPEEEGGLYSRALELKLDFDDMTAVRVWEFRHDPDIFSECCANVTRLLNGNTVIVFPDLS